MAETRDDGDALGVAGSIYAGTPNWGVGTKEQTFVMRAWSPSLGCYVTWDATVLDVTAGQAPDGSGTLIDLVWLKTA